MIKDLYKFASDDDEKNLISRIYDNYMTATTKNFTVSSCFLNQREQMISEKVLNYLNADYFFYGGYDDAERKILIIKSNIYDYENYIYPIKIIKLTGKMIETLSHRDFLGSLMSYGIKRNVVGDIVKAGSLVYIFCLEEISEYIITQIDKIGKIRVNPEFAEISEIKIEPKEYKTMQIIVSSMRIDCVVSGLLKISRQDCAKIISSGDVSLNWESILNISKIVEENQVISVKGYGRMFISKTLGNTKKGRIVLEAKKYI